MTAQTVHTLVNPQNGNLAFKTYDFEGASTFDHIQRLNYYSMILVTHGTAQVKAGFSDYHVSGSSLLCFAPYQPFMIAHSDKLKGTVIHFHPDFFCIHKHHKEVACNGVLFNNVYQPPLVSLNESQAVSLLQIVSQMKEELKTTALAQSELLISYLKIFLINASRIKVDEHPHIQQDLEKNSEPIILQHLKEAIETHYKEKHSASDYASILNITPSALAKASKVHFNKTLTDLISERIIIEAKRELYLTSKAVKQIAFELGFNDEHYFSRFFKKNADISPQIYRDTVGFARAEAS